jgi:hypothetical protein
MFVHLSNDLLASDVVNKSSVRVSTFLPISSLFKMIVRRSVWMWSADSLESLRNRRVFNPEAGYGAAIAAAPPPPPSTHSCLSQPCNKPVNPIAPTAVINTQRRRNRGACALTSSATLFSNVCNVCYLKDRQQLSELLSVCCVKESGGVFSRICSSCHGVIVSVSVLWRGRNENAKMRPFSCRVAWEHIKTGFALERTYWNVVPLIWVVIRITQERCRHSAAILCTYRQRNSRNVLSTRRTLVTEDAAAL